MKHSLLTERADGTWELSAAGWDKYRRLASGANSSEPTESNPLASFKPKDASSYIANVAGRVLTKSRAHEALIDTFGRMVATRGFVPSTNVHPRDLVLERGGRVWLVEAKVLYHGNSAEAVRGAVGQLLEYRHFFYSAPQKPALVALFSEAVGDAFVDFLGTLRIEAIWAVSPNNWNGSQGARRDALI